jgi:hypothetical protein
MEREKVGERGVNRGQDRINFGDPDEFVLGADRSDRTLESFILPVE